MTATIKGRDISAPMKQVMLNGKVYTLVFNNHSARIAEDIYEDVYERDKGYYAILNDFALMRHRAVMAICFAGMVAGGAEITWEEFDATFKVDQIIGISDVLREGVEQSLPDEDADEAAEGNPTGTPTGT